MRKGWSIGVAALLAACAGEPETGTQIQAVGPASQGEAEPNELAAAASPLTFDASGAALVVANVFGNGDVDVYTFTATAGDRLFAATMTSSSSSGNGDSVLEVLASDGVTVLETDADDGTYSAQASSIAGLLVPADGTYYLRVRHNLATNTLRPYHLWAQLRRGAAEAEVDPNDAIPGQPLTSGWVAGEFSTNADVDVFAVELAAGDSLYASLDLDPERDTVDTPGALALQRAGEAPLGGNDPGAATPDSEALFVTVAAAGTYYLSAIPSAGMGTYQLNATIIPRQDDSGCTTYASSNVPVLIPTGPGIVSSTVTLPDDVRISDLEVVLDLDHDFMSDLDVDLTSPAGTVMPLFTDVGATTVGTRPLDVTLSDDAALPISAFGTAVPLVGYYVMPELNSRLEWFDGQRAGGTWTLTLRDDATGDGGTLNGWALRVCPQLETTCPAGASEQALLATDFEADDGGFTHSGTLDEWERGTPGPGLLTTCASGTSCWVTDLDATYDASSSQDLVSPAFDLSALAPGTPVYARWQQAFQLESATFDHAEVGVRSAGTPSVGKVLWQHLGADMVGNVGNPLVALNTVAGWARYTRDISDVIGVADAQLRFHLDSDTTVQRRGLAIDDVEVVACTFRCGDGVLYDAGLGGDEVCDDGNATDGDGCDSNCTATACGNGVLTDGEACDDGNATDGDGCDSNCTATACGNGIVTDGEACDDGNATDGDGCDSNCTATACGNGIVTDGETCDDGNATDGDGCDSNCTATACGNGIVTDGEACDDGNTTDGDGCDANCTATACGNGIVTDGEACDDGNATDGDGCDSNCTATACGNGIVTGGEACDDGNTTDGDGCQSDCTVTPEPACGDGTLDAGEACDDGNTTDGDGCQSDCTVTPEPACGDGTLDAGEACDDGNTTDGDGCDAQCDLETVAGGGGGCCQTGDEGSGGAALAVLVAGLTLRRRRRRTDAR